MTPTDFSIFWYLTQVGIVLYDRHGEVMHADYISKVNLCGYVQVYAVTYIWGWNRRI
jgi:hypothetical protein